MVDSVLIDDYDEMDEEYEKIKLTQQVLRKSKTFDELLKDAEEEVQVTKQELDKALEKVGTSWGFPILLLILLVDVLDDSEKTELFKNHLCFF